MNWRLTLASWILRPTLFIAVPQDQYEEYLQIKVEQYRLLGLITSRPNLWPVRDLLRPSKGERMH